MGRITEHLKDRPRDAVWWVDVALVALVLVLGGCAIGLGAWGASVVVLNLAVLP